LFLLLLGDLWYLLLFSGAPSDDEGDLCRFLDCFLGLLLLVASLFSCDSDLSGDFGLIGGLDLIGDLGFRSTFLLVNTLFFSFSISSSSLATEFLRVARFISLMRSFVSKVRSESSSLVGCMLRLFL